MRAGEVELLEGEGVLLDSGPVVLTNQRLVARETALKGNPPASAFLRDIASFRRVQGGDESKLPRGMKLLAVGVAFLLLTFIIPLISGNEDTPPPLATPAQGTETPGSDAQDPAAQDDGRPLSIANIATSISFLIGALALIFGFYYIAANYIRVRPHTVVVFQVPGGEDIPVKFPGWDNPDVETLTRRFVRAKRGM